MKKNTIGRIIRDLRAEVGCSREKVCRGLCSSTMLRKIENDECSVDKFVVDLLIERLGKYPLKLETILSEGEYRRIRMADLIEELAWKGRRDRADYLLAKYEADYAKRSGAHRMFVLRMKAYISRRIDGDYGMAEHYIRQALEQTLPGVTVDRMGEYRIAGMELENLLALGACMVERGACGEAEELLESCLAYIEQKMTDPEGQSLLRGKCAWILSKVYGKKGDHIGAYGMCEEAVEGMRRFGNLYFMLPLLERLSSLGREIGASEAVQRWEAYRDAVAKLYREFGEDWYCMDSLFHGKYMTAWHLDWEFVRQERLAQGMTQEELIEGVYQTPETLSRVERGRESPTGRSLDGLLENLGIGRGKYRGTAVVEDFRALERQLEVEQEIGRGDFFAAQRKLERLRQSLDMGLDINRMAVGTYQDMIDRGLERVDDETLLRNERELLELSYWQKGERYCRVPMKNEVMILNQILISLRELGRIGEANDMLGQILNVIRESRLRDKYRSEICNLFYTEAAIFGGDRWECCRALSYETLCGNGMMVPFLLRSLALGERDGENKPQKALLWQSCYMSELFYRNSLSGQIRELCREYYGEEPD